MSVELKQDKVELSFAHTGKPPCSHLFCPQISMTVRVMNRLMRLRGPPENYNSSIIVQLLLFCSKCLIPMAIILAVDIFPFMALKTRAFGAVATGSMKALEQVMTADMTK